MKVTTLCFLVEDNKVLLAMKKRGFGIGKYNGVGGKVEVGESVAKAIVRETEEEIGVKIKLNEIKQLALIKFHFDKKPEWEQECHVFVAKTWRGTPVETEEMRPEWFPVEALPFDKMWVDDPLWLPYVLAGKFVSAEFTFTNDGKQILLHSVKTGS